MSRNRQVKCVLPYISIHPTKVPQSEEWSVGKGPGKDSQRKPPSPPPSPSHPPPLQRRSGWAVGVSGRTGPLSPRSFAGEKGGPQRRGALHRPREARVARMPQPLPLRCGALARTENGSYGESWPGWPDSRARGRYARPARLRSVPSRPLAALGRARRTLTSPVGGPGHGEPGPHRPCTRAAVGTARACPDAPGECGAGALKLTLPWALRPDKGRKGGSTATGELGSSPEWRARRNRQGAEWIRHPSDLRAQGKHTCN